jgi:hypothetical protein
LYGWKAAPDTPIRDAFKRQKEHVTKEFDDRSSQVFLQLNEQVCAGGAGGTGRAAATRAPAWLRLARAVPAAAAPAHALTSTGVHLLRTRMHKRPQPHTNTSCVRTHDHATTHTHAHTHTHIHTHARAHQGLNVSLYWKNPDPRKYVNVVPTSAITGEGIPDLLQLMVKLTQSMMQERLTLLNEPQCTVRCGAVRGARGPALVRLVSAVAVAGPACTCTPCGTGKAVAAGAACVWHTARPCHRAVTLVAFLESSASPPPPRPNARSSHNSTTQHTHTRTHRCWR